MNAGQAALPPATDTPWHSIVETPQVLVDLDIVEANIAGAAKRLRTLGLQARPHIKTHKIPMIARAQMAAGAVGVTCQTLWEAQVMADAGIGDILVSYNILGASKLNRLRALASRVNLSVVADNAHTVDGLAAAFADAPRPLDVLVEIETGMQRCGVLDPDEAVALARAIEAAPGLRFKGLLAYPPPDGGTAAGAILAQTADACRAAGLDVSCVSSGGTPDLNDFVPGPAISEYRPGAYVYNDRSLIARGACDLSDCALSVATTVISAPAADRAVIDAGSKSLSSDLFGLQGHGLIIGHEDCDIAALSEEHGHVRLKSGAKPLRIGEVVRVIPNHACVVTNLFDHVIAVRGEAFAARIAVEARGRGP